MLVVLIGESASGKSTLQSEIIKQYPSFRKIVTYTTRPMREGEVDGVDYHFVSLQKFWDLRQNDAFIEVGEYRGWYYGSPKEECLDTVDKNRIIILTPYGLRMLKQTGIKDLVSIYLMVDRRSRLIKLLERGDDIEEAYRRNLSDVGMFDGVVSEVDYVMYNDDYAITTEMISAGYFRDFMERSGYDI